VVLFWLVMTAPLIHPPTVRRLREEKGWYQAQLAKKARLSYSYVSKIEAGTKTNPSGVTALRLARALGVEVFVLGLEPEPAIAWIIDQAQNARRTAAADAATVS
jgi:transcriptional regulator with XRE-family HTH domain